MNYKIIIIKLYFSLIHADGHVNDYELTSGKSLIEMEDLDQEEFKDQMELLKSKESTTVLAESIQGLKKLNRKQQLRIVAWLCLVANGDGFMDKTEWQLIYRIYHKELNLPLEEIFKIQKELSQVLLKNHRPLGQLKSVA